MSTFNIIVSIDTDEAEAFVAWLIERGHKAKIGDSTANYVDGVSTSNSNEADEIMNGLWNDYCNA